MLLSDKRLLSNDERKQILSTCMLVSTQKMKKKNVPIVINDGKHTWRIEDGVFPLQMLSYNHKAYMTIKKLKVP